MKYYFAPLEGITGYVFRNVHSKMFPGLSAYYAPFISPGLNVMMNPKERRDVLPENQKGYRLIPQIMVNHPAPFIGIAKELYELGYEEININMGCPSGTVVGKGKGAGFLKEPYLMEKFFDEIFKDPLIADKKMKISVKTRIGLCDEWEFEDILNVYQNCDLTELVIHPRVREDYYKKPVRKHVFADAYEKYRGALCYNGDLFTVEAARKIEQEFPAINSQMFGRGLLYNPALVRELQGGPGMSVNELITYHELLLEAFSNSQSGEKNILYRAKELWFYWGKGFEDADKQLKVIRKTDKLAQYKTAVDSMIRDCKWNPDRTPVF